MTYDGIDERKEYVKRVRASFMDDQEDWTHPAPENSEPALGGSVIIRMILGLFLFLLFVFADVSQYSVGNFTTEDLVSEITSKDSYTNFEKYVMMLFTGNNTNTDI